MESKYQFEGIEWTVAHEQGNEKINITVEDYFSWGTFDRPTKYVKCNLKNQALRKCVFDSQQFVECDFSKADLSDSQFINCLFLNCKFANSNFGKTSFIGSAFVESNNQGSGNSNFDGASMSQARFLPSSKQKTIIVDVTFYGLGFRHSVFNNVIIRKTSIDYCSFENALLENCDIDLLKLDRSSCRGIVVKECTIDSFISTVEKAIGAIGILEMLHGCKHISLEFANHTITDTKNLIGLFIENARAQTFAKNGKLFEFVNIMQYLYKQSLVFRKSYLEEHNRSLVTVGSEVIDGFKTTELSEYLYSTAISAYGGIIKKGESIDLDDILYSLKMMYFLNIHEYKFMLLLESMLDQMNISVEEDYSQSVTLSQINYYLNKVANEITNESYQITILNESVSWKNSEQRLEFQKFIDDLFRSSGNSEYRLISLHEGSAEAILNLIRPEYLITVIVILGVRVNYCERKGIEFRFDPSAGLKNFGKYLNTVASIFPLLGRKKVEEDVFNQILKSISDGMRNYVSKNTVSGKVEQGTARKTVQRQNKKRFNLADQDGVIGPDKKENQ